MASGAAWAPGGSFMRKWMLLVPLLLGMAGGAWAQEIAAPAGASEASGSSAGNPNRTIGAMASSNSSPGFLGAPVGSAALPGFAAPIGSAALAAAAPEPQVNHRDSERERWQLGLGFTYVKFRSPAIDAGMEGLNTSVTYFTNDWLGVEGNITAAFGRKIFVDDRTKYAGITGGPKIVMRERGWEPWAHVLFGMAHVNPQLAGVGKNGVAIQLGGGADFFNRRQISLRVEGDWVRTQLYSQSQNNFQVVTGAVFHF
jgi:Outer membrane protein beta-barrel domain